MKNNNEEWKELDDKREIKKLNNEEVVLVAPKGQRNHVVPLFCPLCELPMKTQEDSEAFLKSKTCSPCFNQWGSENKIDYKSKEWKEYKENRELLATPIINIV